MEYSNSSHLSFNFHSIEVHFSGPQFYTKVIKDTDSITMYNHAAQIFFVKYLKHCLNIVFNHYYLYHIISVFISYKSQLFNLFLVKKNPCFVLLGQQKNCYVALTRPKSENWVGRSIFFFLTYRERVEFSNIFFKVF